MDLVDEEDHIPCVRKLLHKLPHALLELAPVFRARNEIADVELHDLLVFEDLRDVPLGDLLGKALHNGGLSHAGLPDKHRVVLRPPGEDLDDPFDLLGPSDHGVELPLPALLGEVDGQLIEGGRLCPPLLRPDILGVCRPFRRPLAAGEKFRHLIHHEGMIHPEAQKDGGGDPLSLGENAEEDMFRSHIVDAHIPRFAD